MRRPQGLETDGLQVGSLSGRRPRREPIGNLLLCSSRLRRERAYDDMDEEDPFNPRRVGSQNPNLTNVRSFCSYSSSLGSQSSLPPPAPAAPNPASASDYM